MRTSCRIEHSLGVQEGETAIIAQSTIEAVFLHADKVLDRVGAEVSIDCPRA